MAARLMNVYLMGTMYAAVVLIPTVVVYWITAGVTPARVICGILLILIVTVIVLLLSCILGWVVARISLKLKNKSFISVLISLLFIGGYYFFYFKANDIIQDIILHADVYGEKIKGAAYGLYLFGRVGEGDWLAAVVYTVVVAGLFALTWYILQRSFLKIATASADTVKVRYVERTAKEKSLFGALLGKEFARFTASANYMLNCGLGTLLIPASGILLLVKGREVCEVLDAVFAARPGTTAILLCCAFCMIVAMNDMVVPSVSLEGKSLWIPQSLPVSPKTVLRAKMSVQLLLTLIPMLFAVICAAVIVKTSVAVKLLLCVLPLVYTVFSAIFGLFIGLRMPILTWTNEMAPVKQSGAVAIAMFGGWIVCVVFAGLFMLVGYKIGAALYMLLWIILFTIAALLLQRWLDTKGVAAFAAL